MSLSILISLVGILSVGGSVWAVPARVVSSPFNYDFRVDGMLDEAGDIESSWSPYWWLNSGGHFYLSGGVGKTVQGNLPANDKWRLLYAKSNPRDTDNGYHPQNLFRLVLRSKWQNFQQQAYFKINKTNLSASPERDAWSGLLLFNRYIDGNNLYYAGIRMDGAAVIKKKKNGTYYTMKYVSKVFPGTYNRDTNPNLLPQNQWFGLRSEVKDNTDGTVSVKLYVDKVGNGSWQLIAEAIDNNSSYGGAAIKGSGFGGIRTDYMDVEFDNYRMTNI